MFRRIDTLRSRWLVAILIPLLLLGLPAPAFAAGSVHITGTVTNQTGGGVLNVSVTATAPGGATVLYGPSLTVANGSYQLDVDPGTYDIHFDPPAGSGLSPIVANNIAATSDQVVNVQLTAPAHTMSGTVRDGTGQPVPGVIARFALVNNSNVQVSSPATDVAGHYTVMANAGVYYLAGISGNAPAPLGFIGIGNVLAPAQMPAYDLSTGDLTQDLQLVTSTLTVTVKDSFGIPVANAPVLIGNNGNARFAVVPGGGLNYVYNGSNRSGTTNSSGVATLTVFNSIHQIGQICTTVNGNQICNTATLAVTGPTDLLLQQPPVHLMSGTVRDGTGQPVPGVIARFALVNNSNVQVSSPATDVAGHYTVMANAGVYYLAGISGNAPAPLGFIGIGNVLAPAQMPAYDLSTGDLTQDLQLVTSTLTVTVKDSFGIPVANAPVLIGNNGNARFAVVPGGGLNYVYNGSNRSGTTNSSGVATLTVFNSIHQIGQICTTVNGNQICNTATLAVTGPTDLLLQQPPVHLMSGTVRDGTGQPVPGVIARFALVNNSNVQVSSPATDVAGHYTVMANAGVYYLAGISGNAPAPLGFIGIGNVLAPAQMPAYDLSTGDLTQDLQLVTSTLTVTVKDSFGIPVANAPVLIGNNGNARFAVVPGGGLNYVYNGSNRSGTTNSSGVATLTVFNSIHQIGQICTTVNGNQICNTATLAVTGPTNLLFQAAPQAPPAPTGLTATTPTGNPPALSWNPVSVAASYRVYRNGTQVGTTTATSFVDLTVPAAGSYTYAVTAVSALNIESSASAPFVVLYTTGPVVTDVAVNPAQVTVGHTATLSATATDAIAGVQAGEYFEGADPGEGNGTPMAVAGNTMTATIPGTLATGQHTFTVRARNSLGNWTRGTLPTTALTVTQPTLNGRVLNGANVGIAAVHVDIVDPANHATVLATTTTNGGGNYAVSVTPGTYDVIFTPPGTTYQQTTKTAINLTDSATLDVVLVLVPTTFSGTLKDSDGVAVPGATVSMHNPGGQTFTTTTAANGSFSVQVNPATYSLTISGSKAAAPSAFVPTTFSLSGGAFDLTDDVFQQFTVSAVAVALTTRSALTLATVSNVALSISTSTQTTVYAGSGTYTGGASYSATTDALGHAEVVLLAGSQYAITATPPPDSGVVTTQFPPRADIGSVDLLLTADIRHFRGRLTDNADNGVTGATIRITGPLGTFQTTTAAMGAFDVEAAAGTYSLSVTGNRPGGASPPAVPDSFAVSGGSINIATGDVDQILRLDAATVAALAQSPFSALLPGVSVQLASASGAVQLYPGGGDFNASALSTATTDSNGVANLLVLKGLAYTTKATPPVGSGYIVTNLTASPVVTGDTSWTITLNRDLKSFTGTVRDRDGVPVTNATVRLDGNEQDQHYAAVTNALGGFTLQVAPNGSYSLQVSGSQAGSPDAFLPDTFLLATAVGVTADTIRDVTVLAVNLQILARDDRQTPVPDVDIAFGSNGSQNGYGASSANISRTTGPDGRTELRMLSGTTYVISATPPAGIGYINTTFHGTSPINQDSETIIEFQNHIPPAPTGLSAATPTNASPALTWNQVENAHHYVVYRGSASIGTSLTASFVDSSLAVDGTYVYRVSAVSEDGYEGPKSGAVAVLYDTVAPVVSASVSPTPNGAGWNRTATTVTFTCTDEASGIAACAGPVTFTTDGAHQATGTATDNAGNVSAPLTVFVNLDQTAPTLGPLTWSVNPVVTGASTGLTVGATDGLSGVDASEYFLGADPGAGNGTPMAFAHGNLSATLGSAPAPGTYSVGVRGRDFAGNWSTVQTGQLVVISGAPQVTSLGPVKVWVGLKNSDDVGTKFDLLAEVSRGDTLVTSGHLDNAPGGGSGFNSAILQTIALDPFAPVEFPAGTQLKIKLYVRNACVGPTHNSGTARLWYADTGANSRFTATIGSTAADYYLQNNFVLTTAAGPARKSIDVAAGPPCSPYKTFGTWTVTP